MGGVSIIIGEESSSPVLQNDPDLFVCCKNFQSKNVPGKRVVFFFIFFSFFAIKGGILLSFMDVMAVDVLPVIFYHNQHRCLDIRPSEFMQTGTLKVCVGSLCPFNWYSIMCYLLFFKIFFLNINKNNIFLFLRNYFSYYNIKMIQK